MKNVTKNIMINMLKVFLKAFLILLFTFHFSLFTSFAAFKDPGFTARPCGMGRAFTAVADDINASWYNPAGLGYLNEQWALFSYSMPYLDIDGVDMAMSYASYMYPFGSYGTSAITWARFNTDGLYSEDIFILTHGYDFDYLSAGLNIKYLNRAVTLDKRTLDDEVFAGGTKKSAISIDIGLLKEWTESLSTGLSIKDINQPDVGYLSPDPVPMEIRAGAANNMKVGEFERDLNLSADLSMRNNVTNLYVGGEMWFSDNTFAARAGANKNEVTLGASYLYEINGPGIVVETHYSFSIPLYIEGSAGSHRISLGLRF